jgi:hypothetical protein
VHLTPLPRFSRHLSGYRSNEELFGPQLGTHSIDVRHRHEATPFRRRALFNSLGKMMRCAVSFIYGRLTSNTLCITELEPLRSHSNDSTTIWACSQLGGKEVLGRRGVQGLSHGLRQKINNVVSTLQDEAPAYSRGEEPGSRSVTPHQGPLHRTRVAPALHKPCGPGSGWGEPGFDSEDRGSILNTRRVSDGPRVRKVCAPPSAPTKPAHSAPGASSSSSLSAPAAPADSSCFFLPLLALLSS